LNGVAGVLLVASAAINITTNEVFEIEGSIEIRTVGSSGTFDSVAEFRDIVTDAADVDTATLAQAVDTTVARTLVITGECSTNNAGNQVSLRHFSAQAFAA
jgi:hypothetical protein